MHALIGIANIARTPLSAGDVGLYLRHDGTYDLVSCSEAPLELPEIVSTTSIVSSTPARPFDPELKNGDAAIFLRSDGNFQVASLGFRPDAPTERQIEQGETLMAFAYLMRNVEAMETVKTFADDPIFATRMSPAPGMTPFEIEQRENLTAFTVLMEVPEMRKMIVDMANNPDLAGAAVDVGTKH